MLRLTLPRLHSALPPPAGHPAAPPRTGEVLPGYRALTAPPSPPVLSSRQAPPVADSDPTPPLSCLRGAAMMWQTKRFAAPAPDRQSTPTYKSLVRAQLSARTFQKILVVKYCCSVITPVFIISPRVVRHLMEFKSSEVVAVFSCDCHSPFVSVSPIQNPGPHLLCGTILTAELLPRWMYIYVLYIAVVANTLDFH